MADSVVGNLCPGRIAVGGYAADSVGRIGGLAQWRKVGRSVAVIGRDPARDGVVDPSLPSIAGRVRRSLLRALLSCGRAERADDEGADDTHLMRAAPGSTLQVDGSYFDRFIGVERKGTVKDAVLASTLSAWRPADCGSGRLNIATLERHSRLSL